MPNEYATRREARAAMQGNDYPQVTAQPDPQAQQQGGAPGYGPAEGYDPTAQGTQGPGYDAAYDPAYGPGYDPHRDAGYQASYPPGYPAPGAAAPSQGYGAAQPGYGQAPAAGYQPGYQPGYDAGYGQPPAGPGYAVPQPPAGPGYGAAPAGAPADGSDDPVTTIRVSAQRVTKVVWAAVGTLVVLDVLASLAAAFDLAPYVLLRFFDGDSKVNFPTAGKTSLMLLSALLMLACWTVSKRRGDPAARGWLLLSGVTAFAFLDESIYLHQSLSDAVTKAFGLSGILHYSWTIVYAPMAVLVGVFVLRDMQLMNPVIRRRLLPAGALFAGGAIALEPIKSKLADSAGDGSLAFRLTAATSDSLELVGLGLLATGALAALMFLTSRLTFRFDEN
jgi:hypothetical protein